LPFFDRKTASAVGEVLLGKKREGEDGSGETGGGAGRRVLISPQDMQVNPLIPGFIWDAFDRLPSQTLPKKNAKPTKRLAALAQSLSRDGLREDARKDAYAELFSVLDGLMARHAKKVEEATASILTVEGETIVAGINSHDVKIVGKFTEVADDRVVDAGFKAARKYAEHITDVDDEDGLFDSHLKIAALARVDGVQEELDRQADAVSQGWFSKYRVAIKGLSDERRLVYDELLALSPDPQRIDLKRPRTRTEETADVDGDPVETRSGHLMSDQDGNFPIGTLNTWEVKVIDAELAQAGFVAWYRNPGRGSADSLTVAYKDGKGHWRRLCPDFVFFTGTEEDVKASIVDPHGYHLSDALPKLRGLADFAVAYGDHFHRIESVAEMKDKTLRVLDLKQERTRKAIFEAVDAEALYLSSEATNY
jgi:hypothetical protein